MSSGVLFPSQCRRTSGNLQLSASATGWLETSELVVQLVIEKLAGACTANVIQLECIKCEDFLGKSQLSITTVVVSIKVEAHQEPMG